MMQKDEGPLLMAWLSYYGQLFGFQNLTLFDNGSSDPLTLHLLDHAEKCGAVIRRECSDPSDFQGKGLHFAEQMRIWDRGDPYDFALPVDCDEFLAVVGDNGVSTTPCHIMAEFVRLRDEKRSLRIGSSLFNLQGRPGGFSVDTEFVKGFLPARSVALVDNGQHNPSSCLAPGFAMSRFTYLHWHNHDFARMQERARRKLGNSLVDPTDRQALLRYAVTPNLPGKHLVEILLEDEHTYLNRYNGTLQLSLPWAGTYGTISTHVEEGPVFFPVENVLRQWSAERYRSLNEDVGEWALGPLMHFLLHGWQEGRQF